MVRKNKSPKTATKSEGERFSLSFAVVEGMGWLPKAIEEAARAVGLDKSEFMRRALAEVASHHSEFGKEHYESWLLLFDADKNAHPLVR